MLIGAYDQLMREAEQAVEQVNARIRDFVARTFEGHADDGRITAVADCAGNIQEITVNVLAKREHDNHSLSNLIFEAVSNAQHAAFDARDSMLDGVRILDMPLKSFSDDMTSAANRLQSFLIG